MKKKIVVYKKRIFSLNKLEQFKQLIENESWERVFQENDTNLAYNKFDSIINNALNLIFPLKNVNVFRNIHKAWVTKGIQISSKRKRFLYKEMLANRITREYYNKYSRILKNVIEAAKQLSNKVYVESAQNKGKAVWNIVKQYTGKERIGTESILKNFQHENPEHILNYFNDKFINQCPSICNCNYLEKGSKSLKNSLFLKPASPEEIFNIIMSLNNKKSVGEDEVPTKLLKYVADIISAKGYFLID